MGALKLPTAFSIATANVHLCRKLGVRFNGEIRNRDVAAYEITNKETGEGWIRLHTKEAEVLHGKVEPFWIERNVK